MFFSQVEEMLEIVWHHFAVAKDQRVVVLEKFALDFRWFCCAVLNMKYLDQISPKIVNTD